MYLIRAGDAPDLQLTQGRPFNSYSTHVNMTSVRLTAAWEKKCKSNLIPRGLAIKPDQAATLKIPKYVSAKHTA